VPKEDVSAWVGYKVWRDAGLVVLLILTSLDRSDLRH